MILLREFGPPAERFDFIMAAHALQLLAEERVGRRIRQSAAAEDDAWEEAKRGLSGVR